MVIGKSIVIMNSKKKDKVKDFKLLSLKILNTCNPNVLKSLHPGEYSFYELGLSENFFAYHVNISAIVGMNGAGKSSLLELIFRMVNNFSAYLVGNSMKRKGADVLYFVPGIQAELHYQIGGMRGILYCHDRIVALEYGENKYLLSNYELCKEDQFLKYENCYKADSLKRVEIARCFFYTVVMNYALQSYNSFDYQDEKAWNYETVNQFGNSSAGNWINSLFHKNDGYSSPIVLNPYRNEGIIDMKTETNLTRDRLSGILVEADKKKREFIEGYKLHHIQYNFNHYHVLNKLPERYKKFDYISVENYFLQLYGVKKSIMNIVLHNYRIEWNQTNSMYIWACVYLVYKTLAIPAKYPSYADFAYLSSYNDQILDEHLVDIIDEEKIKKLIKEIRRDKSHITTKIRQTLNFLNNFNRFALEREEFDYSYYRSWLGKEKENPSLEATLELMPPPIFDSEIFLKRNQTNAAIPFYKLSSGERQFLFMMSSIIYHVMNIKSVPTNRISYRCINLVLDEVEMCFHPEYQRTFIYKLLKTIQSLHLNTYCSFNILITTHSPFLLSDIPQSNVLYLENGSVASKEKMQNPFAANVNDILYQSFFLNNGFMGEFAKQKIIELIKKKNKYDYKEAQELIKLIGEPLLRERLKEMWEDD